jgi:hypothetical protein
MDLVITDVAVLGVTPGAPAITGDVSVRDGRVQAVGGVQQEARQAAAAVVDGAGAVAVPLVVETAGGFDDKEIRTGNEATFALVGRPVSQREALRALVVRPPDLRALLLGGVLAVRDGREQPGPSMAALPSGDPRLGGWLDSTGHLLQTLTPDGRYDETRAARRHAYQGRYWVHADRIVYLDDTGFWAFGEFSGAELHHAGYVMTLQRDA